MTTLLELARKEHARLAQVIRLLEGATQVSKTKPRGKVWTAAERHAMSVKMKAVAAKRKKA
jgi:hypothetical protein